MYPYTQHFELQSFTCPATLYFKNMLTKVKSTAICI